MSLSFLYLAFVRVLQLLRLFRRDNEELAIELACSVTRWPYSAARWPAQRLRPGAARRTESASRPAAPGTILHPARDTAPLASGPGPAPVDVSAPLGSTERPRRHRRDRPTFGEREPHLGLSEDPR